MRKADSWGAVPVFSAVNVVIWGANRVA